MITTPKDYYSLYHRIQSENAPSIAVLLPTDERIYKIDLNARTVEAPEYLSVEKDHRAETIYFTVNRFYDFFDLTQAVCVINYINALGDVRTYPVPFYDVETFSEEDLILFPWVIDGDATKAAGDIVYSIKFYKLTDSGKSYMYNVNTLPAKSKILHGLGKEEDIDAETDYLATLKDEIFQRIENIEDFDLYWEESE